MNPGVRAQKLRTVIIKQAAIADVATALNLLMNGSGLTALQSGVNVEAPIADLTLLSEPKVLFDGFTYVVFLFVTTA